VHGETHMWSVVSVKHATGSLFKHGALVTAKASCSKASATCVMQWWKAAAVFPRAHRHHSYWSYLV
jgi:hypothetical protein